MKRILGRVTVALALLLAAALIASVLASQPPFDETLDVATLAELPIAPVAQALTFARSREQGRLRILLVTRYQTGTVTGVDLNRHLPSDTTDPVKLFREHGYEVLAAAATATEMVTVSADTLEVPFDAREQNIGIGANYREHARESGIDEQPFVFPKIAQPTPFNSAVARGDSLLLDYEAELGLVALDDIAMSDSRPARFGLVLCNELTDRWTLVRHLRRGTEMGTSGFAEGKSREGFASIGALLVIPRDLESFYKKLELRLYLNGRLRQQESPANMVWSPAALLAEIFRRADWTFHHYDKPLPLLDAGQKIAASTIIFSGTPAGVIFKPHNLWNPWAYLRADDEVVIRSPYLGVIRNAITR